MPSGDILSVKMVGPLCAAYFKQGLSEIMDTGSLYRAGAAERQAMLTLFIMLSQSRLTSVWL